jgi:hypothetical protein
MLILTVGGRAKVNNMHRDRGARTPKAAELESKKAAFLAELRTANGVVSTALERSGLNRRTAYDHFRKDRAFAEDWLEVVAVVGDEVLVELRRRALGYEIGPDGTKRHCRSSDRLLIYLMQLRLKQNKWRGRIMDVARGSLEVVDKEGAKLGLSNKQIRRIREALIERYGSVPLD